MKTLYFQFYIFPSDTFFVVIIVKIKTLQCGLFLLTFLTEWKTLSLH